MTSNNPGRRGSLHQTGPNLHPEGAAFSSRGQRPRNSALSPPTLKGSHDRFLACGFLIVEIKIDVGFDKLLNCK